MRLLITLAFLLSGALSTNAADSLTDVHWKVQSVTRDGKPADDFTITETVDGNATDTCTLDSIRFNQRQVTLHVRSATGHSAHELKADTTRLPRRGNGTFKITLLGKDRPVRADLRGDRLLLTIQDLGKQPLIIQARRVSDPRSR